MTEQLDVSGLPAPDATALAHSRRVAARVDEAIREGGGAIRFSEFMELVLYAPGLGYYSAGSRKFGPAGDFVTAPEISPVFSRCVARGCAEVLRSLDGGDIVEIGGGSGAMAAGILDSLDDLGCLPGQYLMLEISADLRERQRRLLSERVPALADRVRWIEEIPADVTGMVLANELLDALPFERFHIGPEGPVYLGVARGGSGFRTTALQGDDALASHLGLISDALGAPLDPGYESEWCPALPLLVSAVARGLRSGVALFIDYGLPRRELYHPQRRSGTLMCHYRHRAHGDPFLYPGLQDITAWVDFTSVAEAATAEGLALEGFTTQAHFLMASGLQAAAAEEGRGMREAMENAAQVRRLTLPGEMGERFKFMALSREWDGVLSGLTGRDLSGSL